MDKLLIGSHVSYKAPKYLIDSVKESISYGSNCFMIYTGPPQNTLRKEIDINNVQEAFKLMEENKIDPSNVIVHAPYIINLASPKESTYELARTFLIEEIKRTKQLGFKYLVLHPGSKLELSLEEGINKIVSGINYAISKTRDSNVVICLETMAGKGSEVGRNFNEIKSIIDRVNDKNRIGVCLDTCHVWESGIDITNIDDTLEKFDNIIGLNFLKVIHLNDSKNEIGASKDRHENIGYGKIGFKTIIDWAYNDKISHIPKILETPYYENIDGINVAPYKLEIEMITNKEWTDFKKK